MVECGESLQSRKRPIYASCQSFAGAKRTSKHCERVPS